MSGWRRWIAGPVIAGAIAGAVSGCTVNPATGEQDFTPLMSPAQERSLGAQEHPKIIRQYGGVHDDPALTGWIAALGGRLGKASELPNLNFTFTVLDTGDVNAFALPGGYIYVTRGMLALANTEAEVAGVLGHEIGHVTARHTAQRYNAAVGAQLATGLLGVLTGSRAAVQAGQLLGGGLLAKYSRDQELQADGLGIRYMSRLSYNPLAQADVLSSLGRQHDLQKKISGDPDADPLASLFASHPSSPERVSRVQAIAREKAIPATAAYGRDQFLRRIDGMIYGDSPKHGFVRDRTFLHPVQRFTFQVPKGYTLINRPNAVYAKGPSGTLVILDLAAKPRNSDPLAYLSREWAVKYQLGELERITINGMKGATGGARVQGRSGVRDMRFVVIAHPRGSLYRLLFVTQPNETARSAKALQRITYSFRALPAREARKLKPLRVRIVQVKPGDTVGTLAKRMALPDHKVERFRVLNALDGGAKLKPGELVKIVAE